MSEVKLQFGATQQYKSGDAAPSAWWMPFTNIHGLKNPRKELDITKNPIRRSLTMVPLVYDIHEHKNKVSVTVPIERSSAEYKFLSDAITQIFQHAFKNRTKLFPDNAFMAKSKTFAEFREMFCNEPLDKEWKETEGFVLLSPRVNEYSVVVDRDNKPLTYLNENDASEPIIFAGSKIGLLEFSFGSFSYSPTLDKKLSIKFTVKFLRMFKVAETKGARELTEEEKKAAEQEEEKEENVEEKPKEPEKKKKEPEKKKASAVVEKVIAKKKKIEDTPPESSSSSSESEHSEDHSQDA